MPSFFSYPYQSLPLPYPYLTFLTLPVLTLPSLPYPYLQNPVMQKNAKFAKVGKGTHNPIPYSTVPVPYSTVRVRYTRVATHSSYLQWPPGPRPRAE